MMRTHTSTHTLLNNSIRSESKLEAAASLEMSVFVMLYKPTWHRGRGERVTWQHPEQNTQEVEKS